jgi:hypothetical protein
LLHHWIHAQTGSPLGVIHQELPAQGRFEPVLLVESCRGAVLNYLVAIKFHL